MRSARMLGICITINTLGYIFTTFFVLLRPLGIRVFNLSYFIANFDYPNTNCNDCGTSFFFFFFFSSSVLIRDMLI